MSDSCDSRESCPDQSLEITKTLASTVRDLHKILENAQIHMKELEERIVSLERYTNQDKQPDQLLDKIPDDSTPSNDKVREIIAEFKEQVRDSPSSSEWNVWTHDKEGLKSIINDVIYPYFTCKETAISCQYGYLSPYETIYEFRRSY